jgi:aryl-alcohol dehydrogenase-like predicted oxidoreductase
VSGEETAAILKHARAAGLDTLDTAIAYGEAEQRLGAIGVGQWQVISKLPPVPDGCADVAAWVRDCVRGSLQRLKVAALHGLLLHRSQDLLGSSGAALSVALAATKSAGLVAKLGVSIYAPEELDDLASRMQLDVVQAPLSIVDRRLASSGWLARLHAAGTEVHVRSVFLQGLLLMDPGLRPARFARWQQLWDQWARRAGADAGAGLHQLRIIAAWNRSRGRRRRQPAAVAGNHCGHDSALAGAARNSDERRPGSRESVPMGRILKIVAIVQARMGSMRFPQKVMQPVCGTPLIGLLLERLSAARRVDTIVLATSDDPRNDALAAYVRELGHSVYRGSEHDVLDRYYRAAQEAGAF